MNEERLQNLEFFTGQLKGEIELLKPNSEHIKRLYSQMSILTDALAELKEGLKLMQRLEGLVERIEKLQDRQEAFE